MPTLVSKKVDRLSIYDDETGTLEPLYKTYRKDEPTFVKTYIEDIGRLHKLPKGAISVLLELIKRVNYQDEIALSLHIKRKMKESIGFSNIKSIDQNMMKLIDSGILIRVARGSFILDPRLFAQGEWRDVNALREKMIDIRIIYSEKGREIKASIKGKNEP